ncbi:MAG: hypothetical protein LH606_08300 [Cytophagaceae bacterium]|nr:hypothetical protein [Cytophagaceae bacterium]
MTLKVKPNSIITYFILTHGLFVINLFLEPVILTPFQNLDYAITLHIIAMIFFITTYFLYRVFISYTNSSTDEKRYYYPVNFFVVSYIIAFIGLGIAIAQIMVASSIQEYFLRLAANDSGVGIRDAYLLSFDEGGISGVIKMFTTSTLSVYLYSLAIPHFTKVSEKEEKQFKFLNYVALVLLITKSILALDRLTILAIIVSNFFIMVRLKRVFTLRNLLFFFAAISIGNFLTSSRYSELSLYDSVKFYLTLSLNNFGLMHESLKGHTYGFETILHPLIFVFRFLGIDYIGPESSFNWEDNPAQYLASWAYQDFGYGMFILYALFGWLCAFIDQKALFKHDVFYGAIYFVILYCVCLWIVVPPFRGLEFWVALLIPVLLIRFFAVTSSKNYIVRT